jgi:hypothetical protein
VKTCTIIFATVIIIFFSFECSAQLLPKSTVPATRGKLDESAVSTSSPKSAGSRITPSVGRVINTKTLTITGSSVGGTFSPVTINTQTLTITGATTGEAFSPVTINTQTLTITGSTGGK